MIQSVDRAVSLLCAVAVASEGLGVRELARRTGLQPTTAHNILKTLESRGMVRCDDVTRAYSIGPLGISLAHGVDPLPALACFAQPYVKKLLAEFGENSDVCTFVGGHFMRVFMWTGLSSHPVLPAGPVSGIPHHYAIGQVLLAFGEPALLEAYMKGAGFSQAPPGVPGDAESLVRQLSDIREQGYVENVAAASRSSVSGFAVPVLGPSGYAELAMNWHLPNARFGTECRKEVLPFMLDLSDEMTRALGGEPLRRSS